MRWVIVFILWATSLSALDPNEMLDDPILESRAQNLDDLLRCVKCRSETIASSNADWAKDARGLVREMLMSGATDEEVLDKFVNAYGPVVLMKPSTTGWNVLLWMAAPALLSFALIAAFWLARGQKDGESVLSADESEELRTILVDLEK